MVVARRDTRGRSVVIMVLVTALVLVTIDSRGSGVIDSLRDTARDVIKPVQSAVDTVFSPVSDAVNGVTNYSAVKDENEVLRRQIEELRGRIRRQRATGADVNDLADLVDLPRIEDATGVVARAISGAPGNFERTVQLDRGSNAGLEVGQPVVTAGSALIGRLTDVSRTGATVTLIDSPGFGVPVRFEKSNARGITEGHSGERDLRIVRYEPPRTEAVKDELVFTAAVDNAAFPPDIPVGKVKSYSFPRGDVEPHIAVSPLVDLDDVQYVKVLRFESQPLKPSNG